MSDVAKAVACALMVVVCYAIWLVHSVWYLRAYWRVIVQSPVSDRLPGVTNLGWFGILLAGVALSLMLGFLLLFRKTGRRESGGMILETERGIRQGGMPGVDRLRPELE